MKVFISFASPDHNLMHLLSTQLVEYGLTPLVAVQRRTPGARLDEKVREMIGESDAIVVLHTPQASRSHWVQQEIGCAKTLGRYVVPLKTRGTRLTAMLDGTEYSEFSTHSATEDFRRVASFLRDYGKKNKFAVGPMGSGSISDVIGFAERYLLHLPHAMQCPGCNNIDVHVFVCPLCGKWICTECGKVIPPSARAPGSRGHHA